MARVKAPLNPFYPLLVVVGAIFTVTAFAYGLMTVRYSGAAFVVEEHPLMQLMRERGTEFLLWEVGALGGLSIAAMATDRFWAGWGAATRRHDASSSASSAPPSPGASGSLEETA
jgi:hypothetical protein